MTKHVDIFDLVDSLKASGGQLFTVTFTKRSTGEERTLQGRFGVTRDLKGGTMKYNPRDKGLFVMWITEDTRRNDGKDNGYRAIPADSISYLAAKGRKFVVSDGLAKEVA
jgi:hypothetical protein